MIITIHRGTSQIGGSCVELEYDGTRIILDAVSCVLTVTSRCQPGNLSGSTGGRNCGILYSEMVCFPWIE